MERRCLTNKRSLRFGLSKVEILVICGVIGAVAAVLFPAIGKAREASQRSHCRNNLKQLGLGLHNYADTYNQVLPPGLIANYHGEQAAATGTNGERIGAVGWSWRSMMLPFISCGPFYKRLDFNISIGTTESSSEQAAQNNRVIADSRIWMDLCPADVRPAVSIVDHSNVEPAFAVKNSAGGIGSTSYYGSAGSFEEPVTHPGVREGDGTAPVYFGGWSNKHMSNGIFATNSSVTFEDIVDGTSHTIGLGEVSGLRDSKAATNAGWAGSIGPAGTLTEDVALSAMRSGEWKLNGNHSPLAGQRGYSSEHARGAYFLIMDGTVRFINENIEHIPRTGLAAGDPRSEAGCNWEPVTLPVFERDRGGCGEGVFGVGPPCVTGESNEQASASCYMRSNYGLYQRLFSISDRLLLTRF